MAENNEVSIQPLHAAVARLEGKTPIATALTSAQWADVPVALRDRAFFSAQVESVRLLAEMKQMLLDRAAHVRRTYPRGEKMPDREDFLADMRAKASALGVSTPGPAGSLMDIRSNRRLGLIYDFQMQQAAEFARFKMGSDPDVLAEWPAQRLIRLERRSNPRDWSARWADAGGAVNWEGAMRTPAVALKSSPIWAALSRFGTPYPPFDFGSGMGVEAVSRREAIALGLIQADSPPQKPPVAEFNANLEASMSGVDKDAFSTLKNTFGDQIMVTKAGKIAWQGSLLRQMAEKILDDGLENFNPQDWSNRTGIKAISLGRATAQTVEKVSSLIKIHTNQPFDVANVSMIIDPIHMHHIFESHMVENRSDQRGVTLQDIELLAHVWRAPDQVIRSTDKVLLFSKQILGNFVLVGFEINPKQNIWHVDSMRIKRSGA